MKNDWFYFTWSMILSMTLIQSMVMLLLKLSLYTYYFDMFVKRRSSDDETFEMKIFHKIWFIVCETFVELLFDSVNFNFSNFIRRKLVADLHDKMNKTFDFYCIYFLFLWVWFQILRNWFYEYKYFLRIRYSY